MKVMYRIFLLLYVSLSIEKPNLIKLIIKTHLKYLCEAGLKWFSEHRTDIMAKKEKWFISISF